MSEVEEPLEQNYNNDQSKQNTKLQNALLYNSDDIDLNKEILNQFRLFSNRLKCLNQQLESQRTEIEDNPYKEFMLLPLQNLYFEKFKAIHKTAPTKCSNNSNSQKIQIEEEPNEANVNNEQILLSKMYSWNIEETTNKIESMQKEIRQNLQLFNAGFTHQVLNNFLYLHEQNKPFFDQFLSSKKSQQTTAMQDENHQASIVTLPHNQIELISRLKSAVQCNLCVSYCYEQRYDDAIKHGLNCLPIIRDRLASHYSLDLSYIIELLGFIYLQTSQFKEAQKFLQKNLQMHEKHHQNSEYVAMALNLIGDLYYNQGRAKKAGLKLVRCLHIRRSLYGGYHLSIEKTLGQIGEIALLIGENERARAYAFQGLLISTALQGGSVFSYCKLVLAKAMIGIGEWQGAMVYLEKELKTAQELYGEQSIHAATFKHEQGVLWCDLNEYDKAWINVSQAYEVRKQHFLYKNDQELLAESLSILGNISYFKQNYELAVKLHRKALQKVQLKYAQYFHPKVALQLNNLALVQGANGDIETAIKNNNEALRIMKDFPDQQQEVVCQALNNLALMHMSKQSFEAAEEILGACYDKTVLLFGKDSEKAANVLINKAQCQISMKDLDSAKDFFRKGIKIMETQFGEMHPTVVQFQMRFGECCMMQKYEEAAQTAIIWFQKALKTYRVYQDGDDNHPIIARLIFSLGNCHWLLREMKEVDFYFSQFSKLSERDKDMDVVVQEFYKEVQSMQAENDLQTTN